MQTVYYEYAHLPVIESHITLIYAKKKELSATELLLKTDRLDNFSPLRHRVQQYYQTQNI